MRLMYCHYHYERSKHPKFYDAACKLLAKAKHCAFTSQDEVDIFAYRVRKALTDNKPAGRPSGLVHTRNADGGQIIIQAENMDGDVARLYYSRVEMILEYDFEAKDFFDVGERYEEGGAI